MTSIYPFVSISHIRRIPHSMGSVISGNPFHNFSGKMLFKNATPDFKFYKYLIKHFPI